MKSLIAFAPLGVMLGLAACGSEPPPPPPEDAPILLQAGEWAVTRKTTGYNTPTVTPAQYQAALKEISEEKICLAVDKDGVPPPDVLAGKEGSECSYTDKLFRKGRLIATLACKSGDGTSEISVEGNYTGDSMTLGTTMTRTQGGNAVLRTTHDLTARRVGDCPAT